MRRAAGTNSCSNGAHSGERCDIVCRFIGIEHIGLEPELSGNRREQLRIFSAVAIQDDHFAIADRRLQGRLSASWA